MNEPSANPCKDCKAHSGITKAIKYLEKNTDSQWTEINNMKKRSLVIMTAVIITLLGVLTNLAILLASRGVLAP